MFKSSDREERAIDEALFTEVANEIEKKAINKGLWTKALVEAENDKKRAETIYIKLRVQNLKDHLEESAENEALRIKKENSIRNSREFDRFVKIIITGFFIIWLIGALLANSS